MGNCSECKKLTERIEILEKVRATHLAMIYKDGKDIEQLTVYCELLKGRLLKISEIAGLPQRHEGFKYHNIKNAPFEEER